MMLRDSKVIISCAVTGGAPFNRNHPAFPVTPAQIAAAAIEAAEAGASIAHIHVRDGAVKPTRQPLSRLVRRFNIAFGMPVCSFNEHAVFYNA